MFVYSLHIWECFSENRNNFSRSKSDNIETNHTVALLLCHWTNDMAPAPHKRGIFLSKKPLLHFYEIGSCGSPKANTLTRNVQKTLYIGGVARPRVIPARVSCPCPLACSCHVLIVILVPFNNIFLGFNYFVKKWQIVLELMFAKFKHQ